MEHYEINATVAASGTIEAKANVAPGGGGDYDDTELRRRIGTLETTTAEQGAAIDELETAAAEHGAAIASLNENYVSLESRTESLETALLGVDALADEIGQVIGV